MEPRDDSLAPVEGRQGAYERDQRVRPGVEQVGVLEGAQRQELRAVDPKRRRPRLLSRTEPQRVPLRTHLVDEGLGVVGRDLLLDDRALSAPRHESDARGVSHDLQRERLGDRDRLEHDAHPYVRKGKKMNLSEFVDTYRDAIAARVVESYPPLYRPSTNGHRLPQLLRSPIGAQTDAVRGTALSLRARRGTTVVGEMGTGKTFIAAAAAHMAGFRRVLVVGPPHLMRKWKREVEQTVPNARAAIVRSISDLEALRMSHGPGPLFAVMSRERAKLSYRWKPATVERWAAPAGRLLRDEETGEPIRVHCCPACYSPIVDGEGVPLTDAQLSRRRHRCNRCGDALWQADVAGPRRFPLADYVKHRMRGFFDLLIADEVHEFKGRGSAQGIAAGILADACGRSLTLTGTLLGGYASTLFHLLYRFSPEIRTEFGRSEEGRWISRYGFLEETIRRGDDGGYDEDGRSSRRRRYRKTVREKPGLAPAALFHLIGHSVFLRLSDVASDLPPYEEQVLLSSMDSEPDATELSQRRRLEPGPPDRFGEGLWGYAAFGYPEQGVLRDVGGGRLQPGHPDLVGLRVEGLGGLGQQCQGREPIAVAVPHLVQTLVADAL